ncbi:MAG: hypothetical protein Q7U20_04360 [Caulobacter sp.]|nr:hypothetical protein [Caulobacter sp.]
MSRRTTTNLTPALAASVLLHGAAVVFVLIAGIYFKKPPQPPGGVPITIVTQGPPNARQAEQGDVEEISAGEEILPEPLPEPAPVAPPLPDPTPKPTKPPAKPPPAPSQTRRADLDFDRLLADVQGARPPARRPAGGGGGTAKKDRTLAVGTSTGPSAGAKGYLLTLGTDLGRRWNPNCLVEGGAAVNIKVSFIVSSNGRLLADPVSSGKDAPPGSLARAGSDAAVRAIRMTEPFPNFPPELYGEKITVNFNANQVCANR